MLISKSDSRARDWRETADNLPPLDWKRVAALREAIQQMPVPDANEMAETLWRMDERMKEIGRRQEEIIKAVENQKSESEKRYVTADQFAPVQRIVYGLVTAILISVVGALMALIITKAK
jgi:hypothetical protein